ncbi:MAG TPA: hypothetical protein VK943_20415 [Arenibaculum sp.]|nr:hypothetical protein [Arenibaculum sp.]
MILAAGKGWAEVVRNRWRNDPWGLRLASLLVTGTAYLLLAGAFALFFMGGRGSGAALLAGIAALGAGMVALATSLYLRLPPGLVWWSASRSPGSPATRERTSSPDRKTA